MDKNGELLISTAEHKKAAVDFLQLIVSGSIDEAYEKHVNMEGKHHNPFFGAGFTALKSAMAGNNIQFPDKQLTVRHVIGDVNMVAVHSSLLMSPGGKVISAVHIFHFNGRLIDEMWDCGQEVPGDSPNCDGAF